VSLIREVNKLMELIPAFFKIEWSFRSCYEIFSLTRKWTRSKCNLSRCESVQSSVYVSCSLEGILSFPLGESFPLKNVNELLTLSGLHTAQQISIVYVITWDCPLRDWGMVSGRFQGRAIVQSVHP
jgi:hypothetical protein